MPSSSSDNSRCKGFEADDVEGGLRCVLSRIEQRPSVELVDNDIEVTMRLSGDMVRLPGAWSSSATTSQSRL
jgi:hypothetical protein